MYVSESFINEILSRNMLKRMIAKVAKKVKPKSVTDKIRLRAIEEIKAKRTATKVRKSKFDERMKDMFKRNVRFCRKNPKASGCNTVLRQSCASAVV